MTAEDATKYLNQSGLKYTVYYSYAFWCITITIENADGTVNYIGKGKTLGEACGDLIKRIIPLYLGLKILINQDKE